MSQPLSSKRLKSKARRIAFETQRAADEKVRYDNRVAKTADEIVTALSFDHNQGELYAYGYEALLLMLAYDIKIGPNARSTRQHEEDRRAFVRGTLDTRVSAAEARRQMEARQLMHDAVSYAVDAGKVFALPPQEDSMVALHLAVDQLHALALKTHHREQAEPTTEEEVAHWTVHFVDLPPLTDKEYRRAPHVQIKQAPRFTLGDDEDDIMMQPSYQAAFVRRRGQ